MLREGKKMTDREYRTFYIKSLIEKSSSGIFIQTRIRMFFFIATCREIEHNGEKSHERNPVWEFFVLPHLRPKLGGLLIN